MSKSYHKRFNIINVKKHYLNSLLDGYDSVKVVTGTVKRKKWGPSLAAHREADRHVVSAASSLAFIII